MKDVFIVIPSFNEGQRLKQVIEKIQSQKLNLSLIVVDDGSKIPVSLKSKNITTLRHQINLGKGAAMKTGAQYAFKIKKAQAVIFMDADGQHNPNDLPTFLKYLAQNYDLVLGSRQQTLHIPLIRFLGNKFASIYLNFMFGVYVGDILSGFRAVNQKAYSLLKWSSPHYGVETEMIARLGKNKHNLKYIEIPIETIYLDKYKGVTLLDGISVLFNSIWWKFTI